MINEAVSTVGGRLLYLSRVSKARDVAEMAKHMLSVEKAWLLSQIGLIPDLDDDVMDEVRFPRLIQAAEWGIEFLGSKNGAPARGYSYGSL